MAAPFWASSMFSLFIQSKALFYSSSVGFVPFADEILSVESTCYLLSVAPWMQPLTFQNVPLYFCIQAHIKSTCIKLFNVYVSLVSKLGRLLFL